MGLAKCQCPATPEWLFLLEIKRALPKVVILRGELAGKSGVCVQSSAVVVLLSPKVVRLAHLYENCVKGGR